MFFIYDEIGGSNILVFFTQKYPVRNPEYLSYPHFEEEKTNEGDFCEYLLDSSLVVSKIFINKLRDAKHGKGKTFFCTNL